MADFTARQYILMQQSEQQKAFNFRNLYQDVSNFMLPRENQIMTERPVGEDKSLDIYDPTAMMDLDDMVSGFSDEFFPPNHQSFAITVKDRDTANKDNVKRYLARATQTTHDELFASNFMMQLNETLTSLIGFGTGNLFSEFVVEDDLPIGLNFKAWDIPTYTIKQDHKGMVDTVILKFPFTARQAYQMFGDDAGEEVVKDAKDIENESKRHYFLHVVRPRLKRNPSLEDVMNMPFESVFINIKDEKIVKEGGYRQQCYAVPRWKKSPSEKYGRGQGTIALAGVKTLQTMWRDFIEFGNKSVNPAREVLNSFNSRLRVTPGAQNMVSELPTSRVIDLGAQNIQFAEKAYQMQANVIHRAFYSNVFAPLENLPGDRRTTVEIYQRVAQSMKKLSAPVYRLQTELFSPVIKRCVLLLVEHGRIPHPRYEAPELMGKKFEIEYISALALAMRDAYARAFERYVAMVSQLETVFPGAKDTINMDRALPDVALSYGLKVEHLSTPEELAAIRNQRAQELAQQKKAIAAQVASEAYNKSTKAPEAGSPAEALVGV